MVTHGRPGGRAGPTHRSLERPRPPTFGLLDVAPPHAHHPLHPHPRTPHSGPNRHPTYHHHYHLHLQHHHHRRHPDHHHVLRVRRRRRGRGEGTPCHHPHRTPGPNPSPQLRGTSPCTTSPRASQSPGQTGRERPWAGAHQRPRRKAPAGAGCGVGSRRHHPPHLHPHPTGRRCQSTGRPCQGAGLRPGGGWHGLPPCTHRHDRTHWCTHGLGAPGDGHGAVAAHPAGVGPCRPCTLCRPPRQAQGRCPPPPTVQTQHRGRHLPQTLSRGSRAVPGGRAGPRRTNHRLHH